jgi:hypothetical protein
MILSRSRAKSLFARSSPKNDSLGYFIAFITYPAQEPVLLLYCLELRITVRLAVIGAHGTAKTEEKCTLAPVSFGDHYRCIPSSRQIPASPYSFKKVQITVPIITEPPLIAGLP